MCKTFTTDEGTVTAADHISFEIEKGDIYGIIGLSGAGKSTLVRCLNMLERPDSGSVVVDGKEMTALSFRKLREERKGMGMIFQHFNLLMQRTVLDNVCFPLEIAGMSKTEARKKAMECLETVGLSEKARAYPAQLSGGQQQRVAIARTLAPQPQVMFMDEPLSNLDAKLRIQMRYELQRLHVETGSTFVYVTHDQMEAMTLSTKICLINNGVLQQYDPPLTVYNHPVNLFTADFVGNPSINFLNAKGSQGEDGSFVFTILNGQKVCFTPSQPIDMKEWFRERTVREEKEKQQNQKRAVEKENKDEVFQYHIDTVEEEDDSLAEESVPTDEDFVLAVRPERIRITEKKEGTLEAVVYGAMPSGMESTLKIRVGDYLLTGVIFGDVTYPIGARVRIDLFGREVLLYDRASGRLVTGGTIQLL